jgi:putative transposase
MTEIARHNRPSDGIRLNFVERVHTPTDWMRLAIDVHLGGLSLSQTVLLLEFFGFERDRSTIHYWVKQADLEPAGGADPDQVALDETLIKVTASGTGCSLRSIRRPIESFIFDCSRPVQRRLEDILHELEEKHDVDDAEFRVDGAPWL